MEGRIKEARNDKRKGAITEAKMKERIDDAEAEYKRQENMDASDGYAERVAEMKRV